MGKGKHFAASTPKDLEWSTIPTWKDRWRWSKSDWASPNLSNPSSLLFSILLSLWWRQTDECSKCSKKSVLHIQRKSTEFTCMSVDSHRAWVEDRQTDEFATHRQTDESISIADPPRRGFEFNFSKVSRWDEGSNSTFQKFPAKMRVRILLFQMFLAKTSERI